MNSMTAETKPQPMHYEAVFRGFQKGNLVVVGGQLPNYPFWMYKENEDPILAHNTDEENDLLEKGYDSVTAASMSNRHLINWFWDLEDFSARQLKVFIEEEYGVDLPIEAGQEKLFQAAIELTRAAPQNQNRLVFMAHTISMNYQATLDQIKTMMDNPPEGATVENIYEEFYA